MMSAHGEPPLSDAAPTSATTSDGAASAAASVGDVDVEAVPPIARALLEATGTAVGSADRLDATADVTSDADSAGVGVGVPECVAVPEELAERSGAVVGCGLDGAGEAEGLVGDGLAVGVGLDVTAGAHSVLG